MQLKPNKKAIRRRRRVARGIGSGLGKTAGRGLNGQRSRSGVSIPAWFEGGQNPLYRRIPKRGFTNIFKQEFNIIKLDLLDAALGSPRYASVKGAAELGLAQFEQLGLIRDPNLPIKILSGAKGAGETKLANVSGKKLIVHAASQGAQKLVEGQGGQVQVDKFLAKRKRRKESEAAGSN